MVLWKKNTRVSLNNRKNRLEKVFVLLVSVTNKFADSLGAHETAAINSRAILARAYAE